MALTEARRKYQREYKRRKRLEDPEFHRKTNERSRLRGIKIRSTAVGRAAWTLVRKINRMKARERTRARLGNICGFFGCGATEKLHIHHNHELQKRLGCCGERKSGCPQCQVCLLCPKHNHMLGILSDDVRIARQVVEFLEKYHGDSNPKVSRFDDADARLQGASADLLQS